MKTRTALLTIAAFLCLAITSNAQRTETVFGRGGLQFSGVWGAWSYNYSSYNDDFVYVRGGYGGLEFNRTVLIGYAGYSFRDEAEVDDFNQTFDLNYNGLYLAVYPNSRKVVHPRFAVIIGGGETRFEDGRDDNVFIVQPSAGLEVNVTKWFKLGLEGGYRFVTNNDIPEVEDGDLSAPFGQLNLKFGFSWGR